MTEVADPPAHDGDLPPSRPRVKIRRPGPPNLTPATSLSSSSPFDSLALTSHPTTKSHEATANGPHLSTVAQRLEPNEPETSSSAEKTRADSGDASQPPRKKRRKPKSEKKKKPIEDMANDLFFVDYGDEESGEDGAVVPAPVVAITTASTVSATTEPSLLLPSHVFLSEAVQTGAGDESIILDDPEHAPMDAGIQFVDDDSRPMGQRYFEPEQKATGRLCSICHKPGHLARQCKVVICLTCGSSDGHITRECPFNITCWNCGRRGHASATCTEPRARRICQLCGSHQHVQNSCPTLWRQYAHLSHRDRESALNHRASLIGLPLGEGGEGFIAWNAECFICGESGHWGYDCSKLAFGLTNKEPPAFSRHNADSNPWPFDTNSDSRDTRFARAVEALRSATAEYDASYEYEEPEAFHAGRNGKQKSIRQARERESNRKRLLEEEEDDEEDDWFNNGRKRASGSGGGAGAPKKARKDKDERGKAGTASQVKVRDEVAAWFSANPDLADSHSQSTRKGKGRDRDRDRDRARAPRDDSRYESRADREEREYLAYQAESGGRYDEARDHGVRSRSTRADNRSRGRWEYDPYEYEGEEYASFQKQEEPSFASFRDYPRDRGSKHSSSSSSRPNRTPDHRGARDRKAPPPYSDSTSASAAAVPHLPISIRGASSHGAGPGKSTSGASLMDRISEREDSAPGHGRSRGHGPGRHGGSSGGGGGGGSKFGPRWNGGYSNG